MLSMRAFLAMGTQKRVRKGLHGQGSQQPVHRRQFSREVGHLGAIGSRRSQQLGVGAGLGRRVGVGQQWHLPWRGKGKVRAEGKILDRMDRKSSLRKYLKEVRELAVWPRWGRM